MPEVLRVVLGILPPLRPAPARPAVRSSEFIPLLLFVRRCIKFYFMSTWGSLDTPGKANCSRPATLDAYYGDANSSCFDMPEPTPVDA